MASLWIESHLSLVRSTKLGALATALKIPKAQALGHLHLLWYWTLEFREYGNLRGLTAADIAFASDWAGDAEAFVRSLTTCGWLDRRGKTYRVHDWPTYADRLIVDRLKKKGLSPEQARKVLGNSWEGRGTVPEVLGKVPEVLGKVPESPRIPTVTYRDLPTVTATDQPEPTASVTDPPPAAAPPPNQTEAEAGKEPLVIRLATHASKYVNPTFGFGLWADSFRRALAFGVDAAKLESAIMAPTAKGREPREIIKALIPKPNGADDGPSPSVLAVRKWLKDETEKDQRLAAATAAAAAEPQSKAPEISPEEADRRAQEEALKHQGGRVWRG